MAETGRGHVRLRDFDVHKVPAPCRFVADLGRVAVAVPILVRPHRLARDVVAAEGVSIGREQCCHPRAGGGAEIVLGDESDDLVTFVAQAIAACRLVNATPRRTQRRRGFGDRRLMWLPDGEIDGRVLAWRCSL